jgi:hypothetical protein
VVRLHLIPTKSYRIYTKIAGLTLAFFLLAGICNATVILVTLASDATYLGADGRITATDDLGNESYGPTCKIHQFGNLFVAEAGETLDPPTGFNVWQYFASVNATSVSDFADRIASELPDKYQAVYTERSRRTGKPAQDLVPGDIGVVGFENGKPAFIEIFFYTENGVIKAFPHDNGKEFALNAARGHVPAITTPLGMGNAAPRADVSACADDDEITSIRCSLAAYIKADPNHINQPIAILKITTAKHEWIEKGACSDSKQQPALLQK